VTAAACQGRAFAARRTDRSVRSPDASSRILLHRCRIERSPFVLASVPQRRFFMSTHTIRLHRVLRTTPDKLYRAFLDADAMCKWLPPNGFTAKMHSQD